jgi:hypothetical protein
MAYSSITRAQLRGLLDNQLDNLSQTFWRTDEKNKLIQDGLRFFNLLTGYWRARAVMTTSANTAWYALPGTITSSMRVSWESYPLAGPTSWHDLDFGRPSWENETTASGGDVPTRPVLWSVAGVNMLAIWPADAAGNSTLIADGIASTPILTQDTDLVDIGQDELNELMNYLQHIASFKEGGKEFSATQDEFKSFLKSCGQRSSIFRASSTYRKYLGLDKSRMSKKTEDANATPGAR